MKCPTCGKETGKGKDHNHRGRRCVWCWEYLPGEGPVVEAKPQTEAEVLAAAGVELDSGPEAAPEPEPAPKPKPRRTRASQAKPTD